MLHRYFAKTVCLNQPERQDRWLQFQVEAKRIGLFSEQFLSVPHEHKYISFCDSQKAMIKYCYDSGAETFLCLEDDAVFPALWHVDEAMAELPEWDIVYFGCNPIKWEPYSKHLRRIIHAWTTHAVAYNRQTAKYILENYRGWELDNMYDAYLSASILPNVNAYCITPFAAIQREGFSDLWGHRTSYGWKEMEERMKI